MAIPGQSDTNVRPKKHTFRPPQNSRIVYFLVRLFLPLALRSKLKVTDVEIDDGDLDILRGLKDKRCLLTPSHSGGLEPYIICHLTKLLKKECNYVAALESFEKSPLNGWFMQKLGAYSIIRGLPDRPSFQMTKNILGEGRRWLIIFPEGQTCGQNDTVMPFQEGVVRLSFKVFEEACGSGSDASLFCVPIAVKYVFLRDMHDKIDSSLDRLEAKLFTSRGDDVLPRLDRLRRISQAMLSANEKQYGVHPRENDSFNERIEKVKDAAISRLEQQLDVTPKPDTQLLDRIRNLYNTVDRIIQVEPEGSDYEKQLFNERREEAMTLYDDLWRLMLFVAIYGDYVREAPTVERFMETLSLLEIEVFNRSRIWGPRKALVKVGAPLDLRDYYDSYRKNRRGAIRDVTLTLESSVRSMIEELSRDGRPIIN